MNVRTVGILLGLLGVGSGVAALAQSARELPSGEAPPKKTFWGEFKQGLKDSVADVGKQKPIVAAGSVERVRYVCYEGDRTPTAVPDERGQLKASPIILTTPCETVIANGTLQRVASARNGAASANGAAAARPRRTAYAGGGNGESCAGVPIPDANGNRIGNYLCQLRDGTLTGEVFEIDAGGTRPATDADYKAAGVNRDGTPVMSKEVTDAWAKVDGDVAKAKAYQACLNAQNAARRKGKQTRDCPLPL